MAIICPKCKHNNVMEAKFCNQCGTKLFDRIDTTTSKIDELYSEDPFEGWAEIPSSTPDLEGRGIRAAFYLFEKDKVFLLEGKTEFILGRKSKKTSEEIDFDFEPFDGFNKGVSRNHAKVNISGKLVTVTDLRSSNGTYLNRKRLMPQKAYTLTHGDIVSLGSLILQYHNYSD